MNSIAKNSQLFQFLRLDSLPIFLVQPSQHSAQVCPKTNVRHVIAACDYIAILTHTSSSLRACMSTLGCLCGRTGTPRSGPTVIRAWTSSERTSNKGMPTSWPTARSALPTTGSRTALPAQQPTSSTSSTALSYQTISHVIPRHHKFAGPQKAQNFNVLISNYEGL